MEVYINPAEYTGREWDELLRAMDGRQIRNTLKVSYRRIGRQVLAIARARLASSGLANAARMRSCVRLRVYSRGGGFMVTVRPHGKQGYYRRRQDGKEKPVVMWAEEGTKERYRRHGAIGYMANSRTGRMPAYHFLNGLEQRGYTIIETSLPPELKQAVYDRAAKLGWT